MAVVAALVGLVVGVGLAGGDEQTTALPSAQPTPAVASFFLAPTAEPTPLLQMSQEPFPVPPLLTARTSARLLVVQGTDLELLDVDTGRRTKLPTVPHPGDYDRLDAAVAGGQLVVVGDNNTGAGSGPFPAYSTTAGPGSRLREIGRASWLRPSDQAGRVWLVVENDTNASGIGTTLTEIDGRGRVRRHGEFPGYFGVEAFSGGFLRTPIGADGSDTYDTELVDADGRQLHLYPRESLELVAGDTAVLVQQPPCGPCRVRILTAGSPPSSRVLRVPSWPAIAGGTLSRDGKRVFRIEQDEPPVGVQAPALIPGRITELDLATGGTDLVEDAWTATNYGPSFQISQDGRWMFFIDADAKSIDVYDLAARRSYRVPGRFETITQLALL